MKKKKILMIVISAFVLCINTISLSKYNNEKNYEVETSIAKAIVKFDCDEKIEMNIDKNNLPPDYNFSIKNYDGLKVNEVDFEYIIEIEESNSSFPVSYKIYNTDTNEEVIIQNGKSEKINIKSNEKQIDNYKIVFDWCEKSELSEEINMKIKIIAVQEKGEK